MGKAVEDLHWSKFVHFCRLMSALLDNPSSFMKRKSQRCLKGAYQTHRLKAFVGFTRSNASAQFVFPIPGSLSADSDVTRQFCILIAIPIETRKTI